MLVAALGLHGKFIAIFVFNVIDIIATLITTQNGFVEVNPVAAFLLQSPALFAVVKLAVCSIVLYWLYRNRQNRLANIASWFVFVMYGLLTAYYVIMFTIYL
jgi:hypothetical protein